MAVETAEDLAAMFHPDDFGVPMVAHMRDQSLPFHGVPTTGYVGEQPQSASTISMLVPRIIATRAAVAGLMQGDEIEFQSGQRVVVNDMHYKGELAIIHYHEHW